MTTNDAIALNAAQVAGVLGLAPSTLAKLRLSDDGPVYCKLGRRVVYRRADLEAWLESRVARDI
jgi:predicted DNA-binding transcriptional regulator AlpA